MVATERRKRAPSDIVENINKKILLPEIQRDYDWKKKDVIELFDSVFRDFPLGEVVILKENDLSTIMDMESSQDTEPKILFHLIKHHLDGVTKDEISNKIDSIQFEGFSTDSKVLARRPQPLSGSDEVPDAGKLVLDGQQRLTSLHIGLDGTWNEKIDGDLVTQKLCIDLLSYKRLDENVDNYRFPLKFIDINDISKSSLNNNEDESENNEGSSGDSNEIGELSYYVRGKGNNMKIWMPLEYAIQDKSEHDITSEVTQELTELPREHLEDSSVVEFLNEPLHNDDNQTDGSEENEMNVNELTRQRSIEKTFSAVKTQLEDSKIHTYERQLGEKYENILDAFIRINTAGKPLSSQDILLSILTYRWAKRQNVNAKEKVRKLSDDINRKHSYEFNIKDVIKILSSIVIGRPDADIDDYNDSDLKFLEENWDELEQSIHNTIRRVDKLGLKSDRKIKNNALYPLFTYVFHSDDKQFGYSDKKKWHYWVCSTSIDGNYSGEKNRVTETVYQIVVPYSDTPPKSAKDKIPDSIESKSAFTSLPLGQIHQRLIKRDVDFNLHQDATHVSNGLEKDVKQSKQAFALLSMIYREKFIDGDFIRENYELDHIYEKSTLEDVATKTDNRNLKTRIDNLKDAPVNRQALSKSEHDERHGRKENCEGYENIRDWLASRRDNYHSNHYLPEELGYEIEDFIEFTNTRKETLEEIVADYNSPWDVPTSDIDSDEYKNLFGCPPTQKEFMWNKTR